MISTLRNYLCHLKQTFKRYQYLNVNIKYLNIQNEQRLQ